MTKIKTLIYFIFIISVFSIPVMAETVYLTNMTWTQQRTPSSNYGWGTQAGVSAVTGENERTYLEIPTDAIGTDVCLHLYSYVPDGSYSIDAYSTTVFNQDIITWNNQPSAVSLLSSLTGGPTIHLTYFNITISSATQYIVLKSPSYLSRYTTPRQTTPYSPYIVYTPYPSECSINFNPDISKSNQTQQYFDYTINSAYSGYNYFIGSTYEPNTYNLKNYQNELTGMSGDNISLFGGLYNGNWTLELYATNSTFSNFDTAILIAESNLLLINESYISPNITQPDIPDIDINTSVPEIPTPPEHNINQTVNNSWALGYYNACDYTINGLFNPMYNFTYWTLTPIIMYKNAVISFNIILDSTLSECSTGLQSITSTMSLLINSIHIKVQNLITYFLVWTLVLLIMRKT